MSTAPPVHPSRLTSSSSSSARSPTPAIPAEAYRTIRLASRVMGGLFMLGGVALLISSIVGFFALASGGDGSGGEESPFELLIGAVVVIPFGAFFYFVPVMFIDAVNRRFAEAASDPTKEIHRIEHGGVSYTEIRSVCPSTEDGDVDGNPENTAFMMAEAGEPLPEFERDERGRILFDSTKRPIRLIFGGAGLIAGLVIGIFMRLAFGEFGWFEWFFVGGWITIAIVAIGFVYEVRLDVARDRAIRKAGWFFVTVTHEFTLSDFSAVVVRSTLYRARYDSTSERYRSRDPKFAVDLVSSPDQSSSVLNLRVFSSLGDARRLGGRVGDLLGLAVEERVETV